MPEPEDDQSNETVTPSSLSEASASNSDSEPTSENDAASDTTGSAAPNENSESTSSGVTEPQLDSDELPEEEELTPELVEEEAIRGDFMLRWAAIFLAVLFGFSQMADTSTLVHIRSGDWMRANGFLPPARDVHSYAMSESAAPNVSWMFDHIVSGVYAVGSERGLTAFKALIAGLVAYLLSMISVRGMPTWWNSICCVFAIAACSIDFLPITDLATLLGLTTVLLALHRFTEGSGSGIFWKLPLVVCIWGNCDPRAYLGVLLIILFNVGLTLKNQLSKSAGDGAVLDTSSLWKAAGLSAVALLMNPSPVASISSAVTTYRVEYPSLAEMRPLSDTSVLIDGRTENFPIWTPEVWTGFEFAYVSGLALIVIAIIVLVTARNREDLPWIVTLCGFILLACLAMHEIPAAALVAAATAGTAAQRWYGKAFRQEYTVNTSEVLFSRGGRAITVLAFAALGFFAVGDHLPTRTPIGIGFEPNLKATMETLGEQLAETDTETRILPTRLSQGDLLIWNGFQSYVDSRVRIFGRYADENSVIHQFDSLRRSIATNPSADPNLGDALNAEDEKAAPDPLYDPEWRQQYDKLGIQMAMIRLSPPGAPAYHMATVFSRSANWVLTSRGPSALLFSITSEADTAPDSFNLSKTTFRSAEAKDVEQFEFARPKDFYSRYLYASRATLNGPLRNAQHFLILDSQVPAETAFQVASAATTGDQAEQARNVLGTILAGPMMAVRSAREAVSIDPQNPLAHKLLASAYEKLNELEQAVAAPFNGTNAAELRYMQIVMALRQAATVAPDDPSIWERLMVLYQNRGRTGLADICLQKYFDLEEERLLLDPNQDARLRSLYEMQRSWKERTETVQKQLDEFLSGEMPEDPQEHAQAKFQLVQQLHAEGFIDLALKLAQDNIDLLRPIPEAEVIRGLMLLETGELEDGFTVLNQLAAVARDNAQNPAFSGVRWHNPTAFSRLAKADYAGGTDAWADQLSLLLKAEQSPELSRTLMLNLPLVAEVESRVGGEFPNWPMLHLSSAQVPLSAIPATRAEPLFLQAIANIESGNLANARFALERLVSNEGNNSYRPLAEIYFHQMSDDADELIASAAFDPWEPFEFPTEASEETNDAKPAVSEQESSKKGNDTEDAEGPKTTEPNSASDSQPSAPDSDAATEPRES